MDGKTTISERLPRGITELFSSNLGPKQGYNTSPLLFNLFINDSNEMFDECFYHSATMGNINLNSLLCEDDLILISET